jgi:hypothetical protein
MAEFLRELFQLSAPVLIYNIDRLITTWAINLQGSEHLKETVKSVLVAFRTGDFINWF